MDKREWIYLQFDQTEGKKDPLVSLCFVCCNATNIETIEQRLENTRVNLSKLCSCVSAWEQIPLLANQRALVSPSPNMGFLEKILILWGPLFQ